MKVENLCINCMKEKKDIHGRCEYCGYTPGSEEIPSYHLEPFTILAGKYLVGKALGSGGFGITYIGLDLNLQMRVAIKEYFPNGYAMRDITGNKGSAVQYTGGEYQAAFEAGREKFINEARTLARCTEFPGIVNVKDCFQENFTAYIVMEYVEGKNLKKYLNERGGKLSTYETLQLMKPVIQSLEGIHCMNLIHRDISPQNIMITSQGVVKLLDFGGAREFLTSGEKSMSVMLKPGYAPEEQYHSHGKQGPWTDVYGLCATMYRCITGEIPPDSIERVFCDSLKKISDFGISCPGKIESIILQGLKVHQEDRIQSMEELYQKLYLEDWRKGEKLPEAKEEEQTEMKSLHSRLIEKDVGFSFLITFVLIILIMVLSAQPWKYFI